VLFPDATAGSGCHADGIDRVRTAEAASLNRLPNLLQELPLPVIWAREYWTVPERRAGVP
jgi:hypothetical protein